MMPALLHAAPAAFAAFTASLVEFVETLTVVLAVGATRGWADALVGSAAAILVLAAILFALGPLLAFAPLAAMQVVVGTLLLLFGLRWLRKAILRAAGVIPLHDEGEAFAIETARLHIGSASAQWDVAGLATAFQITLIEGLEVVFVVLGVSAGRPDLLVPAAAGAGAALLLVLAAGAVLHRPLARVPENALKFAVGVTLCALGTFWIGDGGGIAWPGADLSLLILAAGFLVVGLVAVRLCRIVSGQSAGPERLA